MAELLVRVVDKTDPDPIVQASQTRRGDVIVAQRDGWPWGDQELTRPDWIIIKTPDMPLVEAEALTTKEPGNVITNKFLNKRLFTIDLDAIGLKDVTGKERVSEFVVLDKLSINAAKTEKTPQLNPFII